MTVQNIMVGVAQKMFCGDPILFGSTQFCGDPELPGSFDWPFLLRRKTHFGEAVKFEWIGKDIGVKTTFDWELLRIGGGRSCRREASEKHLFQTLRSTQNMEGQVLDHPHLHWAISFCSSTLFDLWASSLFTFMADSNQSGSESSDSGTCDEACFLCTHQQVSHWLHCPSRTCKLTRSKITVCNVCVDCAAWTWNAHCAVAEGMAFFKLLISVITIWQLDGPCVFPRFFLSVLVSGYFFW